MLFWPYQNKGGWVYIMSSPTNSTLYVGVTSDISSRVSEHKSKVYPGSFNSKYNCVKLVYYKRFDTITEAIFEEIRIKGGSRRKKEFLINSINVEWRDLYGEVLHIGM